MCFDCDLPNILSSYTIYIHFRFCLLFFRWLICSWILGFPAITWDRIFPIIALIISRYRLTKTSLLIFSHIPPYKLVMWCLHSIDVFFISIQNSFYSFLAIFLLTLQCTVFHASTYVSKIAFHYITLNFVLTMNF